MPNRRKKRSTKTGAPEQEHGAEQAGKDGQDRRIEKNGQEKTARTGQLV
jgi:hypothetical protein